MKDKTIVQDYIQKFYPNSDKVKISTVKIIFAAIKDRGFRAVMFYRISRWFHIRGCKLCAKLIERLIHRLCFCEIPATADIGPGFMVYHPFGLVIGVGVRAGRNFNVRIDSTFGGRRGEARADATVYPVIGDNVAVGAGVRVLGPVNIGDNVTIGANSVVINNIPQNCVAAGVPARIIKLNNAKVSMLEQTGELSELLTDLLSRVSNIEKHIKLDDKKEK
ncbi:MAG: hypothetical protein WC765_00250 [Phycisphaerae bacterium]|jgi:serine O-acetyltransferase